MNNGRTRALNVTLSTGNVKLAVVDFIDNPPTKWRPPTEPQRGVVVMPGKLGHYMYTPSLPRRPRLIEDYLRGTLRILL